MIVKSYTPTCDNCGSRGETHESLQKAMRWMQLRGWGSLTVRLRGGRATDLCPDCVPRRPPDAAAPARV